jgi:hypothetical protein
LVEADPPSPTVFLRTVALDVVGGYLGDDAGDVVPRTDSVNNMDGQVDSFTPDECFGGRGLVAAVVEVGVHAAFG